MTDAGAVKIGAASFDPRASALRGPKGGMRLRPPAAAVALFLASAGEMTLSMADVARGAGLDEMDAPGAMDDLKVALDVVGGDAGVCDLRRHRPPPTPREPRPWRLMSPGQSVLMRDNAKRIRVSLSVWKRRNPDQRWITRKEGDGIRVWRVM